MSARLLGQTGRVLITSGLAGQTRPRHLVPLVRALRQTGPSLAALVATAAVHRPNDPAVIDERGTLTYRELDEAAARIAAGLLARTGTVPSIAVLCRNHRGFVITTAAAGRLGADVALLNTEFAAPQLADVLDRVRPDVIVADEEFLPHLDESGAPVIVAWHDSDTDRPTLDDLIADHRPHVPTRRPEPGKITILTSGTTGKPKGVPRTPGAMAVLPPVVTLLRRSKLRAGDPLQIGIPLFHGFGLAMWGLAALLRSPVVLRRRFTPETALADAVTHHVAAMAVVPVMLQRLLAVPDTVRRGHDLRRLHMVLSGGAPLRPELATRFADTFGDVLFNGYGASEVGIVAVATPADLRAAPGTVGRGCEAIPIRVLDQHDRPVPVGQQGTIHVGGPSVFDGYTGGGTKNTVDGLMNTGDVGHLDTAGRLFIDGRADDMIVSGGENVYPGEVEDVLASHPAVADVAVIGAEDAEFGQRLVAYVVPAADRPDPDELAGHVKRNLARYKVPREFVFLDQLPRNASGKLLRRHLGTGERP
ncbi:acyl-CoA synthetase (AMP-forming)/AMP-acid ligase II [Herbihabitans rhizosphaerae]|uniref:Acyl-CoA synthetase (AMP-forming)/AMP-acid ligase II n=1 Tax=Herbihabitans rhizosphaerae TaxID=1872711 RepID=A0A4V2ETF3_9PSEU|nr:AMP-binding protein [Herbihabitans rhizosphaerae]RZS40873.1 acyl-CoA synthetase (AMP-forming)/AMP-acid ligase II [Herbihabitans rhizosphaerae]